MVYLYPWLISRLVRAEVQFAQIGSKSDNKTSPHVPVQIAITVRRIPIDTLSPGCYPHGISRVAIRKISVRGDFMKLLAYFLACCLTLTSYGDEIKVYSFHPTKIGPAVEVPHHALLPNRIYFAKSPVTGQERVLLSRSRSKILQGSDWFRQFMLKQAVAKSYVQNAAPQSDSAVLEWFGLSAGTVVAGSFFGLEAEEAQDLFIFRQVEKGEGGKQYLDAYWEKLESRSLPIIVRAFDRFENMGSESGMLAWEFDLKTQEWQILPVRTENGKRVIRSESAFTPGIYSVFDTALGQHGSYMFAYLYKFPRTLDESTYYPLAVGSEVNSKLVDSVKVPETILRLEAARDLEGFEYVKWSDLDPRKFGASPYKMIHAEKDEALVTRRNAQGVITGWEKVTFVSEPEVSRSGRPVSYGVPPSREPTPIPGMFMFSGEEWVRRIDKRLQVLEQKIK